MRKWWRVTDLDHANPYTIPKAEYSEDGLSYGFRNNLRPSSGHDGSVDISGSRRSPRDAANVRLGFLLYASCPEDLQDEINAMLAAFEGDDVSRGLRKIWRWEDPTGEDRRYSWARLKAKPNYPIDFRNQRSVGVSVDLILPDPLLYSPITAKWLTDNGYGWETITTAFVGEPIDPELTFAYYDVSASPKAITLTNEGDQVSTHLIFRFESDSAAGFSNLVITNNTTGETLSTTRDAVSVNDVLSINCRPGLARAQYSADDGVTWADDTGLLTLGTTQVLPMSLNPGDNSISIACDGTPNYDLLVWWRHAWRD